MNSRWFATCANVHKHIGETLQVREAQLGPVWAQTGPVYFDASEDARVCFSMRPCFQYLCDLCSSLAMTLVVPVKGDFVYVNIHKRLRPRSFAETGNVGMVDQWQFDQSTGRTRFYESADYTELVIRASRAPHNNSGSQQRAVLYKRRHLTE